MLGSEQKKLCEECKQAEREINKLTQRIVEKDLEIKKAKSNFRYLDKYKVDLKNAERSLENIKKHIKDMDLHMKQASSDKEKQKIGKELRDFTNKRDALEENIKQLNHKIADGERAKQDHTRLTKERADLIKMRSDWKIDMSRCKNKCR